MTGFLINLYSDAIAQRPVVDSSSVFKERNYPDSLYKVFCKEYSFHEYRINIVNVKGRTQQGCCSFILIAKGQDTIYRRCYPVIESLGGCAGIYSSDSNHFSDYFFISKFGDYNGRLIILNAAGKILDLSGAAFYISVEHDFIFADQDRDIGGLTIWSLAKNKLLYDSEMSFSKGDFTVGERFLREIRYDQKCHYLIYLKVEEDVSSPKWFVLKFDNQKGNLSQEMMDKDFLQALPFLTIKNSPTAENQEINCFCGKPGMY